MSDTSIYISTLLVNNIHCPSCVSYVQDLLRHLGAVRKVDASIIDHRLRIEHDGDIVNEITQVLLRAAFEVDHVTVTDASGRQVSSYAVHHDPVSPRPFFPRWSVFMSDAQKKHIENCNVCHEERKKMAHTKTLWRGWNKRRQRMPFLPRDTDMESGHITTGMHTVTRGSIPVISDGLGEESAEGLHSTTIQVEGMTHPSCVSAITKGLYQMPGVESVTIDLMANKAKVIFHNSMCTAEDILEAIENIGYDARVQDVHSLVQREDLSSVYNTKLSIEGMTCGSCVGTISRGLQELSFIKSANVDLIGNSATINFEGKDNLGVILATIEDLGYEASVASVEQQLNSTESRKYQKRKVEINISGMYCSNCPTIIVSRLQEAYSGDVRIMREPSLISPLLTVTYEPRAPNLTIRTIIGSINSVDSAYHASVYHTPSLGERSHNIQRKERNRTMRHLFLTFLSAIPTFVIGVVYMSLVPETNSTRQWLERPMWSGLATRMDWAMFIMTTPVMFYGANLFHFRALKEIWSLWKPGSKVPFFRRFYRFGSMNLLISAGTSVAYFSSLAVLIMDATTPQTEIGGGQASAHMFQQKSVTYFDTVTFLTFFILIGKYLEAYSKAKTGDAVSMLSSLRPTDALLVETAGKEAEQTGKPTISRVSIDLLEIDDVVNVAHGACPPTDGIICQEGSFLFDESSLTGESRPVKKSKGDQVYTGTVNISDPVRVEVSERGGKSMLDQIVNVVREGQARRAPIEGLADFLTGYFTPVITLLAITTWIVWLVLGKSGRLPESWLDVRRGGWAFWSVEFAIAVFVVACPCGIGLAAPTALFVGGGLAASHGILVQGGGEAFQEASKLDTICFDKTGTLTEGRMKVTNFELLRNDLNEEQRTIILALAKALEESSNHPVAKAVNDYCTGEFEQGPVHIRSIEIKEVPGQGMTGVFQIETVSGSRIYEAIIGNEKLIQFAANNGGQVNNPQQGQEKHGVLQDGIEHVDSITSTVLSRFRAMGCSTAVLAMRAKVIDDDNEVSEEALRPMAMFAITDPIRPEAREVLASLRSHGISVHMCTGDNPTTARVIAAQLDIPVANVRAGAMPQDKATYIQELQHPGAIRSGPDFSPDESRTDDVLSPYAGRSSTRKIVAFVGDGTNDTPALTFCDVSIAVSHPSSSDIALTSSSFILLNSSLESILTLVTLSRRVFTRVKFNFAWAAVYNIVLIPVAAGILFPVGANADHGGFRLSPVWASLAMAASSVSVVLSSLALRLPELKMGMFNRKKGRGLGTGSKE